MHRYELWRNWDYDKPVVNFIGLNPSTADEHADDPTIRRCIGFAKAWDFGGIVMTNLFTYRATNPKELLAVKRCGPDYLETFQRNAVEAGMVVVAWGIPPGSLKVAHEYGIEHLLVCSLDLWCLGTTKNGYPKHPLYLPASTVPTRWE